MTYQQPDGQQPYGQPSYGQQPYGQPSYAQQPQQNTGTGTNTGAGVPGASQPGYPSNYNYNTYIPPKAEPALGLPWYGIPFPKAVARFFKKYATFSGRASRSEYWFIVLFNILVSFAWWMIVSIIASTMTPDYDFTSLGVLGLGGIMLYGIYLLAILVPNLALTVRRLHDSNHSGWWLLGYWCAEIILGIVIFIITINTLASILGYYGYARSVDVTAPFIASMLGFTGNTAIVGLLLFALRIAYIVFMCLPSKAEGQRFDKPEDNPQYFLAHAQAAGSPAGAQAGYGQQAYQPAAGQQSFQQPAGNQAQYGYQGYGQDFGQQAAQRQQPAQQQGQQGFSGFSPQQPQASASQAQASQSPQAPPPSSQQVSAPSPLSGTAQPSQNQYGQLSSTGSNTDTGSGQPAGPDAESSQQ